MKFNLGCPDRPKNMDVPAFLFPKTLPTLN